MATMRDLANLLGVEIEEEFKRSDSSCPYRITNESMEYKDDTGKWTHITYADTILDLLNGNDKIIKRQWKPKYDDIYFYVNIRHVHSTKWDNDIFDYSNYALGNCFRTKDEAEACMDKIIGKLKEIYKNGRDLND